MSKKGLGKFVAGAAVGAGLGILFAPKKGTEIRKELKEKIDDLLDKIKSLDKEDIQKEFEQKINEIKKELEDLDKEKVLKIAKKKGEDIKEQAQKLVDLAVEKGTPVLEKAANEVREKAIDVTKSVLDKLEKEGKLSLIHISEPTRPY